MTISDIGYGIQNTSLTPTGDAGVAFKASFLAIVNQFDVLVAADVLLAPLTNAVLVTPNLGTPSAGVMTNVTGTAAGLTAGAVSTITGLAPDTATTAAAQPNITSVGTLTVLVVDNITIDGNTISSTAGTDLNITPLAGQQVVIDGAIVIDAGVITGATSITSTVFVGALTGQADTVATITGLAPDTATTAASQPNITSLGTLTVLAVDNITIDGNTISSTAGTDLNITPLAGQQVVIDGAVTIDADLITGATMKSFTNDIFADHVHAQLRNETGSALAIGDAVYISGYSVGQELALVTLADASTSATMPCIAILDEATLANNTNGDFVEVGTVTGMDTSAWSVGDELYISTTGTSGNTLTATQPTGTGLIQKVASVLRSHATLGVIEVFGAGRSNGLPNIADTKIWIGDASGVPQEFALSGDVTMTAGGVTTISAGAVDIAMLSATGTPDATTFLRGDNVYATPAGSGDMVLASAQTNTGVKTFNDTTMKLRNVADTFDAYFVNTNTADRIYTLQDAAGTIAFTTDITGTNSNTNTGDQTTIVGITGTKAEFDTAVTDGNILYVGDSQALATGVSDVTATAGEVNLLDLAGLTAGDVLSADTATTASWKAQTGGAGGAFTADANTQITPTTTIVIDQATTDEVILDLSGTINKATSGNYSVIKADITETSAPGTDDRFIDYKVGGVDKFNINNAGDVISSGVFRNSTDNDCRIQVNAANFAWYDNFDSYEVSINSVGIAQRSDRYVGWTTGSPGSAVDVSLYRDGVGQLGQRAGTTPQGLAVFSTWTDGSNNESIRTYTQAGGNHIIASEAAGTGVVRDIEIKSVAEVLFNERADHVTTPAAGTGLLWVSSAAGAPLTYTDDTGTDHNLTAAGSGDVTKVATPLNDQVGVWTGDGTIEGLTTFTCDLSGNVTAASFIGPLTGNADTVTTITGLAPDTATTAAAQANITSVGTLTILAVDNITIDGNTISSTAGVDLNITPLAGQQLVLDGTVILDAGVITGATSITSTTFVGSLTGQADTVATNADLTGHITSTGNAAILGSFTIAQLDAAISDDTLLRDSEVDADIKTLVLPASTTISAFGATLTDDATAALARVTLGVDQYSKTISIESPTATEDLSFFFSNVAITVTEIRAVLVGSATPSVTWTVRHGTDRSLTGAECVTGGTVTTSVTTGSDVTSFNDATIVADSFVWVETTAQSGTVTSMQLTVYYTID